MAGPASPALALPCGPGSSPSSPTRRATGGGRRAAARGSPCARRTSFLGGAAPSPEEGTPPSNGRAARGARAAARGGPARALVPLPARARRGRDGACCRSAAARSSHGRRARARAAARRAGGDRMSELELRLTPPAGRLAGDADLRARARAGPAAAGGRSCVRSRSASPSPWPCSRACSRLTGRTEPSSSSSGSRGRRSSWSTRCRKSRPGNPTSARVSREEAERRVGFELLDVGEPDAVFARGQTMASLVYGPVDRPRLVLRSSGARSGTASSRRPPARARRSRRSASTASAASSSRATTTTSCSSTNSSITDEPTYLAGTVLLWNRGPLLLRLEGDLTRAEAVELAESVE